MKKKPNTQPTFIIRRARATDLDAIHRLNRELQRYERALRASRLPARSLPRSYVEKLWRTDRRNAGRLFVATAPTCVIAFLACVLESDILESQALAVQITDLIVTARWRGRRVSAALIAMAEEFARKNKARSLAVTTLAENANSRRAYRILGFRESAVTFERPIATHQLVARRASDSRAAAVGSARRVRTGVLTTVCHRGPPLQGIPAQDKSNGIALPRSSTT
jgi:GNAT superfamily N-acetyltransferase